MFFGLGIHVLIALYFAVHAIRRGHNLFWLIILFSFPMLGSIVYFFVAYLPELRQSRGAHVAKRAVANVLDPGRELREATQACEVTPTINNQLRLANALLGAGRAEEALQHYTTAASGPFAGDSLVLRGLARCQLSLGQAAAAATSLEQLFASDRDARRHPDAALLYARSLSEAGREGVREAFVVALEVATDAEPRCRYADWLMQQGGEADVQAARELYAQIVRDSKLWHKHARNHNAEWLSRARAVVG